MSPTEAWNEVPFFPTWHTSGGSIVESKDYQPSDKGTIVYLNGGWFEYSTC
jgi:hypothetical protein